MRNLPELAADFRVTCPEASDLSPLVGQIRARGNVPILLQDELVLELKRSEFLENWRATCDLARARVDDLVKIAGDRIHQALGEDEIIDEPTLASDTIAFYLLALRQKGVKHPFNLSPCEVRYYLSSEESYVQVN